MQLHFYTSYFSIKLLREEGETVTVYTKYLEDSNHIYVGFDIDKYSFHQKEEDAYWVTPLIDLNSTSELL